MRKKVLLTTFTALMALLWSCNEGPSFEEGQMYNGFRLVESRFVPEVNAQCLYFQHEKSGARLMKIAADDANKLFSVSFKTIPDNDYGTPHIMEHAVLNGSESFPVKSPFDLLLKGSLNTFLNAMTGSDFTTYPVASMNDKDYFNLMHVYMDAVFKPLIYTDPNILKQEGWHYELDNIDGEIVYKGVVYNEMKGAYSSPQRELSYQINKLLFPDNTYGVSSGGYPTAIPKLTNEDFIAFHQKFYHPSNSFVLLYGDADLNEELAFLDESYFSGYERSDAKIEVPLQAPFSEKKTARGVYSVPEGSGTDDKTFLSYSVVTGLGTDQSLVMALDVLTEALVNHESAPLRRALQDAGIGKDVYAWVSNNQQNVMQITVQNANPEDQAAFDALVESTLQQVAEEGLDTLMVEGIINRQEFRLREGNSPQKGLMHLFSMVSSINFGDDVFAGLEYEKPLAELKEGIRNGMLEQIIQEQILNNPHRLVMALAPQPGLENKQAQKTREELAAYKASLSAEELEALVEETKALIAYQQQEDSPEAVATLPMLQLSDISPEVQWYETTPKEVADVPVLHYNEFTSDIVYSHLFFDLQTLPRELLPYGRLLAEVLGKLNTENYSYGELDNALNIHTGGFSSYLSSYLPKDDDEELEGKLVVFGKATADKADELLQLTEEILLRSKINDAERLGEVLTRHQSQVESNVKNNGISYALDRLSSYYSRRGSFGELTGGLSYYDFLTEITENFEARQQELIQKLEETARLVLNSQQLTGALTGSEENFRAYVAAFEVLAGNLNKEEIPLQSWAFTPTVANEGFTSASMVQYVTQGYDFRKLGYAWSGKMQVFNQILSRDYLQNVIRVQGGAYGGFANISPSGAVYLASYRDPNLKETLENFAAAPEFFNELELDSTAMTRFIIGTIAGIDRATTASQRGSMAYSNYFGKKTKEQLETERSEILTCTLDDIKALAPMLKDILDQQVICVYGNDQKIEENAELFGSIRAVTR